jgi:hypothetical protein
MNRQHFGLTHHPFTSEVVPGTPPKIRRRAYDRERNRTRSGMQAPQVCPQPVRRTACSADSRSACMRRATSSKVTPAHSHRVMAGPTRGVRGPRAGPG